MAKVFQKLVTSSPPLLPLLVLSVPPPLLDGPAAIPTSAEADLDLAEADLDLASADLDLASAVLDLAPSLEGTSDFSVIN